MQNTDNVDFYNILAPHYSTTSRRMQQQIEEGQCLPTLGFVFNKINNH